jgi:glycosyltransferase involved in cell wall biosynthesis
MKKVGVALLVKEEAPYLVEWIAYHKALGFEIIVADNGGDDATSEIIYQLHKKGILYRFDIRGLYKPQIAAYRGLLRIAKKLNIDILGFIDADEFFSRSFPIKALNSENGADYILKQFKDKKATQLSYHWICYGSKTNYTDSSLPVLERLTYHSKVNEYMNVNIKSFVLVKSMFNATNLLYLGPKVFSAHFFSDGYKKWFIDNIQVDSFQNTKVNSINSGVILHYQIKTWDEFLLKAKRGDSTLPGNRYTKDFFNANDFNDIETCIPSNVILELKTKINQYQLMIQLGSTKIPTLTWMDKMKKKLLLMGTSKVGGQAHKKYQFLKKYNLI